MDRDTYEMEHGVRGIQGEHSPQAEWARTIASLGSVSRVLWGRLDDACGALGVTVTQWAATWLYEPEPAPHPPPWRSPVMP